MNSEIKQLRAERAELIGKLEPLARAARTLTPEEQDAWDAMTAKIEDIDARLAILEDEMAAVRPPIDPATPRSRRSLPLNPARISDTRGEKALRAWARLGTSLEQPEDRNLVASAGMPLGGAIELRAQSKGNNSEGGYTLVPSIQRSVNRALLAFCPVLELANVINTSSGEDLRIPTSDDTSNNGAIISENSADSEQDLTFTEVLMKAYMYSSKIVRVSYELLEDSQVDLGGFLGTQLGERLGRAMAADFLTGNGSSKPTGIVYSAGTVSAASATAIATDDIINVLNAMDPAYLQGDKVRWLMSAPVLSAIRKLKDSTNQPIFQSSYAEAGPGSLFGYPVAIAPGMDSTFASTKKTLCLVNLGYYAVRQVGGIQLLRADQRYWEYRQSAFVALHRVDGKPLQTGAMKVLTH